VQRLFLTDFCWLRQPLHDPATVFTYVRANFFDGVITIVPAKPGEADAVLQETGEADGTLPLRARLGGSFSSNIL